MTPTTLTEAVFEEIRSLVLSGARPAAIAAHYAEDGAGVNPAEARAAAEAIDAEYRRDRRKYHLDARQALLLAANRVHDHGRALAILRDAAKIEGVYEHGEPADDEPAADPPPGLLELPTAEAVLGVGAEPSAWVEFPAGTLTLTFAGDYRGALRVEDNAGAILWGRSSDRCGNTAMPSPVTFKSNGRPLRIVCVGAEPSDGDGFATLTP